MPPKILVTGAAGQIGAELVPALRLRYGNAQVVAAVHKAPGAEALRAGPTVTLDVVDEEAISKAVRDHGVDTIYHLAALLSAVGEDKPDLAWEVNMKGLKSVLDVARRSGVKRVFWPSSIAVFGPNAPRTMTPQNASLIPTTIYGVSKVSGELLCNYYFLKYGLDVRSLRYPGLISSEAPPGGGTTDYAVEIFYAALEKGAYTCFLRKETALPMMYMPDALDATISIMETDVARVKLHGGYNLSAMSFSAEELAAEIGKHVKGFSVSYAPDRRQKIADSWPMSVDDSEARKDWGWSPKYGLPRMTEDMLSRLGRRLKPQKDV